METVIDKDDTTESPEGVASFRGSGINGNK
jgi:hypothetical protein